MIVKINSKLKNYGDVYVTYDAIEKCSNCNKALAPEKLYSIIIEKHSDYYLYVADFCSSCKSVLITEYKVKKLNDKNFENEEILRTSPRTYQVEKFDENIEKISPQFVKIYNQALQAETIGLDEIAGLGYRKSVEFLIKDYAIYKNPEKEEEIKNTWMKVCIEKYIDNDNIKLLAERSDWIGNDEAHYVRKQEDRDIKDMKKFIKAMVYFIGMTLITDDAASMEPKK